MCKHTSIVGPLVISGFIIPSNRGVSAIYTSYCSVVINQLSYLGGFTLHQIWIDQKSFRYQSHVPSPRPCLSWQRELGTGRES